MLYRSLPRCVRRSFSINPRSAIAPIRLRPARAAPAFVLACLAALPALGLSAGLFAQPVDICDGPSTRIDSPQPPDTSCILDAGEDVRIGENGSLATGGTSSLVLLDGAVAVENGGLLGAPTSESAVIAEPGATVRGDVINRGMIQAAFFGLLFEDVSFEGRLENATGGEIRASAAAAAIAGGVFSEGVHNDGLIQGEQFGLIFGETALDLDNRGTIAGSVGAIVLFGESTGDIRNAGSGRIAVVDLPEPALLPPGAPRFGALSLLFDAQLNGNILNDGQITSLSAQPRPDGVGVYLATSVLNGELRNTGLIAGDARGLQLVSGSRVVGSLINDADGVIRGGGDGIELFAESELGGITNAGLIEGGWNGIGIYDGSVLRGDFDNSGQLRAFASVAAEPDADAFLAGLNLASSSRLTGTLINSGSIEGERYGISVEDDSTLGFLNNLESGLISGGTDGVQVVGGSTLRNGIFNRGRISGGEHALLVEEGSTTGVIVNTGVLDGNVELADSRLILTALGAQPPRVIGAIRGNAASSLTVESPFDTEGELQLGRIVIAEGGELSLRHRASVTGGLLNEGALSVPGGVGAELQGDYTQSESGMLRLRSAGALQVGALQVNGAVNLADTVRLALAVDAPQAGAQGGSDALLGASGGINGGQRFVVTDDSTLFDYRVVREPDALRLQAVPGIRLAQAVAAAGPAYARGVASGLDGLVQRFSAQRTTGDAAMDELLNAWAPLRSREALVRELSPLAPTLAANLPRVQSGLLRASQRVLEAHRYGQRALLVEQGESAGTQSWLRVFGTQARQDPRSAVPGHDLSASGLLIGADWARGADARLGVAFAWQDGDAEDAGGLLGQTQRLDLEAYQLMLYANRRLGADWWLDIQGDIGLLRNRAERNLSLPNGMSRLTARHDARTAHLGVGLARNLTLSERLVFTHGLRLDLSRIHNEGWRENGTGAAALQAESANWQESLLRAEGALNLRLGARTWLLADLELHYDLADARPTLDARFLAGSPVFSTPAVNTAAFGTQVGLGLSHRTQGNLEFSARYVVEDRSQYRASQAWLRMLWMF